MDLAAQFGLFVVLPQLFALLSRVYNSWQTRAHRVRYKLDWRSKIITGIMLMMAGVAICQLFSQPNPRNQSVCSYCTIRQPESYVVYKFPGIILLHMAHMGILALILPSKLTRLSTIACLAMAGLELYQLAVLGSDMREVVRWGLWAITDIVLALLFVGLFTNSIMLASINEAALERTSRNIRIIRLLNGSKAKFSPSVQDAINRVNPEHIAHYRQNAKLEAVQLLSG